MDLQILEHHPQRVLEAFRRGEFDSLEVISQADERDFFQRCFQARILARLAESMPSARKKHEVPRWFILAANLSLKLHQENSFLAFERVVRCGGLLAALPPELARKHLDAKTRAWALQCQGFNDKNSYDRATPCDQDTLRKALKDAPAQEWLDWFNGPVQKVFQSDGFFDPEGVFVGDGSYLFVPDNPAYEGSVVMWFDEHNHPVNYEKLDPEQRRQAHRQRCYKWVSLLHLRGTGHVYAAAALLPGSANEIGPLFELVEKFVSTVGKGVIKWLLLDRGFLDGERIRRCKEQWQIDVVIPLKKNMDLWTDAWALAQCHPWQRLPQPQPVPRPIPPNRPPDIRRREAKRQQTLQQRKAAAAPPTPDQVHTFSECCRLGGFTSWTAAASLPLSVGCYRDHYADGHVQAWAILTTHPSLSGPQILEQYARRSAIEERHRQLKCFYDLTQFRSRHFSAIAAQVVMVLLTYTLRQWQIWKWVQENLANLTPEGLLDALKLLRQWIVIYWQLEYAQLPVVTFAREAILLEGQARAKALRKLELLERELFSPVLNPRPVM